MLYNRIGNKLKKTTGRFMARLGERMRGVSSYIGSNAGKIASGAATVAGIASSFVPGLQGLGAANIARGVASIGVNASRVGSAAMGVKSISDSFG